MAKKSKVVSPAPQETFIPKPIGEVTTANYLDIANYVNSSRHMCDVLDGCKPSYRRLIWAGFQFPKGKLIPTTKLIAEVSNYHPHSTTGIEGTNAVFVNSGIFSGEGSFGFTSITGEYNPPAATRYTKNRVSDLYHDIMGDALKYVEMVESPVEALEPKYLPSPLPICLFLSTATSGLGFSVSTLYPNFSPISLYQAYLANDPTLLEPRVDLELDKKKSELAGLWRYGKGKVVYSYHTQKISDPASKREGVLIYGDTSIFTPKLTKIRKLMEDGKAYMEDMTDETGPKLFIGRVPGARGITLDDIWKITESIKSGTLACVLNVTDGRMTYRIPLYDWLDYTIKNYQQLMSFANQDKIRKTEFEIKVQEATPIVADYILNQNPKATDKELITALELPAEVVSEVLRKPISVLRKNKDNGDKVKALKAKLKTLKAFDPVVFTSEIIQKL